MQTGKNFSKIALAVMVGLFLLIWCSCNPYKRLSKRPPLTFKDSAALLARCVQISPLDTTIAPFIPQIPTIPDSTSHFKALSDSLGKIGVIVRDSILTRYKDTCRSAVRIYKEGYKLGYDIGTSDSRVETETMYKRASRTTDSLYQRQFAKMKSDYNLRLISAANAKAIADTRATKYQNRYNNLVKWTWGLSVAFLLAVIICILLWKFKRQARAANNIINDVKDFK